MAKKSALPLLIVGAGLAILSSKTGTQEAPAPAPAPAPIILPPVKKPPVPPKMGDLTGVIANLWRIGDGLTSIASLMAGAQTSVQAAADHLTTAASSLSQAQSALSAAQTVVKSALSGQTKAAKLISSAQADLKTAQADLVLGGATPPTDVTQALDAMGTLLSSMSKLTATVTSDLTSIQVLLAAEVKTLTAAQKQISVAQADLVQAQKQLQVAQCKLAGDKSYGLGGPASCPIGSIPSKGPLEKQLSTEEAKLKLLQKALPIVVGMQNAMVSLARSRQSSIASLARTEPHLERAFGVFGGLVHKGATLADMMSWAKATAKTFPVMGSFHLNSSDYADNIHVRRTISANQPNQLGAQVTPMVLPWPQAVTLSYHLYGHASVGRRDEAIVFIFTRTASGFDNLIHWSRYGNESGYSATSGSHTFKKLWSGVYFLVALAGGGSSASLSTSYNTLRLR